MPLFKNDYNLKVSNDRSDAADDPKTEQKSSNDINKSVTDNVAEQTSGSDLGKLSNRFVPHPDDYIVRDDDELTSSDEEPEKGDSEESSFKSWFGSRRCSRSANESSKIAETTECKTPEISQLSAGSIVAEGTPSVSKSTTPSRRSFRSFFRRDTNSKNNNDPCENKTNTRLSQSQEQDKVSDELTCNIGYDRMNGSEKSDMSFTSHGNIWKSWRHNQNSGGDSIERGNVLNPSETEILTKEQKRERNLTKLAVQLSDVVIDHGSAVKESIEEDILRANAEIIDDEETDSTSSSIERAQDLKEKMDIVFSPGLQKKAEISPITPPADAADNPYKYVFDASGLVGNHVVYDHAWLHKESVSFHNFDSTLKLLTKNIKSLETAHEGNNFTISEVSKEIFDFVKHVVEMHEIMSKEREELNKEFASAQSTISELNMNLEVKSRMNENLAEESRDLKKKIGLLDHDLNAEKEQCNSLKAKIEEIEPQKWIAEKDILECKEKYELTIKNLTHELETKESLINETKINNSTLELKAAEMQKSLNDLIIKHEVLQEKHGFISSQLSGMMEKERTKEEVNERQNVKNLEMTANIKKRYDNTIGILKVGNLKIQENFNDERRKVLDLRRERKTLIKRIQLIDCHRSQALQFMSHLMLYYRGIIPENMLLQFDNYLKSLSAPYFSSSTDFEVKISDKTLENCQKQIIEFYNDFARPVFLDQIVTKHVAYMRSNNFLSSQLVGLRKQIVDYEQYVSRLLRDIQVLKKKNEKNSIKIDKLKK